MVDVEKETVERRGGRWGGKVEETKKIGDRNTRKGMEQEEEEGKGQNRSRKRRTDRNWKRERK